MPTYTQALTETAAPALLAGSLKEKQSFRNIFGTRGPDTPATIADVERELAHVRKLLGAQETARLLAQEKVIEAQRQLKAFETETIRVRGELQRTQSDLADSKQERTSDLRRVMEREVSLCNDLVEVRGQITRAQDKVSVYKKMAALCLALLIPVMIWAAVNYWQKVVVPNKAQTVIIRDGFASMPRTVDTAAPQDFASGVQRLDQALNRFRHDKAEDVLRGVHDANAARGISVCPFEWNGGQISMVFGNQPGAGLGASVTRCADAVDQTARINGF